MEPGSIIIGLVAACLCALPFILMSKSRRKDEKILLDELKAMASSESQQINEYDFSTDSAIGLSHDNSKVYYYKNAKGQETKIALNLAEYENCSVNKVKRIINNTAPEQSIIDKLELVFSPKNHNKTTKRIVIFQTEEHFELTGQLQFVSKWADKINAILHP